MEHTFTDTTLINQRGQRTPRNGNMTRGAADVGMASWRGAPRDPRCMYSDNLDLGGQGKRRSCPGEERREERLPRNGNMTRGAANIGMASWRGARQDPRCMYSDNLDLGGQGKRRGGPREETDIRVVEKGKEQAFLGDRPCLWMKGRILQVYIIPTSAEQ
eukprot:8026328-Pyramimonas_sp.AAC.1